MNRTSLLKLLYLVGLVVFGALALLVVEVGFHGRERLGTMIVVVAFLVPGRISAWLFRDLYRGRSLFASNLPAESIASSRAFLATLERRPWVKPLLWLAFSFYTTDAEAMAWNNVGAAHLSLHEIAAARQALERALSVDPKYPLPHYNLVGVALLEGNHDEAVEHAARCLELGYRATSVDALIHEVGARFAALQTRFP